MDTVEFSAQDNELAESAQQTLISIGVKIRESRQTRGMTLQALGDATGLSPSMLSLVERGRASPSIGSLIVVANALGVSMSDLVVNDSETEEKLVVRSDEAKVVETAQHVVRRLLKDDRAHGLSIAVNEYAPHTGNSEKPISHEGFEYGFILDGELTVEVDGQEHTLQSGDLISYKSTRMHKLWNNSEQKTRTLWINLARD
ncbi:cupin domain-containing protein (plasmid) [Rhizobium sp. TRM96647]|uniref:cupin domain-containing protein n=1 Tax=unclassified Rhizobium TaxID=2613769 RepID=UPI0021E7E37D|nr:MULTISPECIES: cupin domain-containing protein [unclassified Rhizobium]MCV3735185.1 cupin domain-containing protein [Rhizobium sp. TRM96647]MCV3758052.1 cupin domain-containing protein [Rhizobium sp. TRM96650]